MNVFNNFPIQLNSTRARAIAESLWGKGGTVSYKTNRKGVYYFGCSGHGGYVVDGGALTLAERTEIEKYVTADDTSIVYRVSDGTNISFFNPYSVINRRIRYNPSLEYYTHNYPLYVFEEDCAWTVLETFTDIRCLKNPASEEVRMRIFDKWYVNRQVVNSYA